MFHFHYQQHLELDEKLLPWELFLSGPKHLQFTGVQYKIDTLYYSMTYGESILRVYDIIQHEFSVFPNVHQLNFIFVN